MNTMQRIIATLSAACIAGLTSQARAAVIASQGFEGSATDTWNYTIAGSGGAASTANPSTDAPASSRVLGGVASFQHTAAVDAVADPSFVTFSPVNVSGVLNSFVQLHLASISSTGGNGADSTVDTVQVFVSLDGAAFASVPDITVKASAANQRWTYGASGSATTTAGTPVTAIGSSAAGISLLTINIPTGTTTAALQIVSINNSNNLTSGSKEIWAIDDVTVGNVPEPASLSLLALGGTALLARRRNK